MAFAYEALDAGGRKVTGVIEVSSLDEANRELHGRNLFVTRLTAARDALTGASARSPRRSWMAGRPGTVRDLLMLAQQMTMMLRAGSRVVPALEAITSQITRPPWRAIVADIQEQVESGSPLSAAVAKYPEVFNESWRAIIAAGESTGQIAEAFERLSVMTKQQQQVRTKLIASVVYPAVLMCISVGVLCVLMFFVLPRFDDLYAMLNTPLPTMTQVLLRASRWMLGNKVLVLVGLAAAIAGPVVLIRMTAFRQWVDNLLVRLPLAGKLARQIILARIFRIWGTAVRSSVPLMESLDLSRGVTRNLAYRGLMDEIVRAVEQGSSIGSVLMGHPLVPRTMASAIATGEQSGQLGESLLFLAGYMEEENTQALGTMTRLIEPVILVFMGVTVGVVAISLFLPLFDLTSA
ncbi:MAG: type II secretion system F family protein, partial [Planctomycetes bacterium]|nr:type II secretion system F family protein [Planctomycetota bacterium]